METNRGRAGAKPLASEHLLVSVTFAFFCGPSQHLAPAHPIRLSKAFTSFLINFSTRCRAR